ncbi:walls Are Thin 1 [Actinidia rufa]|uniref:WAT1-related protein n=1 Tax=Actinidia rufa TaxID=165716 RepID=A0A7J0E0F0_9ERIC|nr:walls Are Thin 1 [Actinidia rufa]
MADTSGSTPRMWCSIPERFQLHLAMLAMQFGYAGFHVVSRAALNMGISKIVFPVYRNILALILLVPFAYFLEKKERPPLTLSLVVQFFLLAVVGIEQVRLNRNDGIAKVMGTILCVAGASVITLYKGPTIYRPGPPLQRASPALLALGDAEGKNWTLGCLFLIGHCLSWAGWLVLQAPVLKRYPARLSFTSYQCFFGVLQFLVIAAFLERDPQAWLVHSRGELLSVFYAGVVASGIAFAVQIWCIDRGGQCSWRCINLFRLLLSLSWPLSALGEQFYYLGGIIGAVLIILGLYFVLWGKSEERKFAAQKAAIQSPTDHGNSRTPSHIKSSLAQPLLPQSTENV